MENVRSRAPINIPHVCTENVRSETLISISIIRALGHKLIGLEDVLAECTECGRGLLGVGSAHGALDLFAKGTEPRQRVMCAEAQRGDRSPAKMAPLSESISNESGASGSTSSALEYLRAAVRRRRVGRRRAGTAQRVADGHVLAREGHLRAAADLLDEPRLAVRVRRRLGQHILVGRAKRGAVHRCRWRFLARVCCLAPRGF